MKKVLSLIALATSLMFSINGFAQTTPPAPCSGSSNPDGNGSPDLCKNIYCHCTDETSSDSWNYTIYAVGNETGMSVEISWDDVYSGGSPVIHQPWIPLVFPYVLATGSGIHRTNIQIRIIWTPGSINAPLNPGPCMIGFIDGYLGYLYNVNPCP